MTRLDDLVAELETAARKLRSGELQGEEAAAQVERCAALAAELGSELDREARDARSESSPGQETLL
jgi:exonuclease VII small subunit